MKQIAITSEIAAHLRRALGSDVNVSDYVVYEAIALNTLPLRKAHPLYKGATSDRGMLEEMSAAVVTESRPVQIMHDNEVLPVGRVFHGQVRDSFSGPELRVLFFVARSEAEIITKIDDGTVDQVSVGVLPKQALCSECGWDFLGEDSSFENIFEGTCINDHVLGEDGVHARLIGLDAWYEMSLVGQGGAQGARIVRRDQSVFGSAPIHRLAANGLDPNHLVLAAIPQRTDPMELTQLVQELTDAKAQLVILTEKNETLVADVTTRDTQIAELTSLQEKVTELEAQLAAKTSVETERDEALEALRELARKALVATGDATAAKLEGKATVAEFVALISETSLTLVAGGKAADAITLPKAVPASMAFRVPR